MKHNFLLKLSLILLITTVISFGIGFGIIAVTGQQGWGKEITIETNLEEFNKIDLEVLANIEVVQGERDSIQIVGPELWVDSIKVNVIEGRLHVKQAQPRINILTFDDSDTVTLKLTLKDIDELKISSYAETQVKNISNDNLRIILSGLGNIDFDNLKAKNLVMDFSGMGDVKIDGKVENFDLLVSGLGEFDSSNLETAVATLKMKGAGNVSVWANEYLNIDQSGLGNVIYYGNPRLNTNNTGLGSIEQGRK